MKYDNKFFKHIDIISIVLLLLGFFTILELKHPFFFFSDDNRTFYLPFFMHNYRSLLNGEIPLYNFHQYLGIAHFSNFQSAIFNPLLYLSIFFSNLIWGHSFWAIDIAVITNIIIGSIGFYLMIKFFTNNRLSSFYGAIVWSLSSFGVFVSDSWWIFSGVIAYFPFMILFGFRLYRKPNIKNMILLILARLFLFYIGHIEYFIHSMIFEFLTLIFITFSFDKTDKFIRFLKKYLLTYPLTLLYTLPILLPAWIQTKSSAFRQSKLDFGIIHSFRFNLLTWLKGLVNPFAITDDFYRKAGLMNLDNFSPSLSHVGYISIALVIFLLFITFKKENLKKKIATKVTIFFLFLIPLLWAFGLLSGIIFYIPILNRFRWPFKLLPFSNFYLIVVSSFGFYLLMQYLKYKKKISIILGWLLIIISLLNFYLLYSNVYVSLNYKAHNDQIPLNEPFFKKFKTGRIFSLGISDNDPFSVSTLGFNYATMLGLNHFAGYDPLVPMKNYKACLKLKYRASYKKEVLPLSYLRTWGVNWYILNKDIKPNYLSQYYFNKLSADSNLVIFAKEAKRVIFFDKHAKPMAYWEGSKNSDNIGIKMNTNSIEITTENLKDEKLIINYLNNDYFKAYLNKTEIIPIKETSVGQMILSIPEGKNKLLIKYSNPYLIYTLYIVSLASLIFLIIFFKKKKSKKL